MASDTWSTRAIPILELIAEIEIDAHQISLGEVADRTGLPVEAVDVELDRLIAAGYAHGEIHRTMSGGDRRVWTYQGPVLAERGSRAVQQWPSDDPFDALLMLLDQRILDPALDPETKTRLERLRGTLVDVGKGAAGGVLAALVRAGLGL
jgi:hypothetical protein